MNKDIKIEELKKKKKTLERKFALFKFKVLLPYFILNSILSASITRGLTGGWPFYEDNVEKCAYNRYDVLEDGSLEFKDKIYRNSAPGKLDLKSNIEYENIIKDEKSNQYIKYSYSYNIDKLDIFELQENINIKNFLKNIDEDNLYVEVSKEIGESNKYSGTIYIKNTDDIIYSDEADYKGQTERLFFLFFVTFSSLTSTIPIYIIFDKRNLKEEIESYKLELKK